MLKEFGLYLPRLCESPQDGRKCLFFFFAFNLTDLQPSSINRVIFQSSRTACPLPGIIKKEGYIDQAFTVDRRKKP